MCIPAIRSSVRVALSSSQAALSLGALEFSKSDNITWEKKDVCCLDVTNTPSPAQNNAADIVCQQSCH
jgi:hypothetical protein